MQTDIQMCRCRFPHIAPLCDNKWHVPFSHFISGRNIATTEKVLVGTELTSNKMTSSIWRPSFPTEYSVNVSLLTKNNIKYSFCLWFLQTQNFHINFLFLLFSL